MSSNPSPTKNISSETLHVDTNAFSETQHVGTNAFSDTQHVGTNAFSDTQHVGTNASSETNGILDHQPSYKNTSEQVYTYLDETMRSIFPDRKTTSECSPWLIYGKPDVPRYYAERAYWSMGFMPLETYKQVIPAPLCSMNSSRVPELYFLMVEYFSSISGVHRQYAHRTPEGFRGLFAEQTNYVDRVVQELDDQFSELVHICLDLSPRAIHFLPKDYVDKTLIPHFLTGAVEHGSHVYGSIWAEYFQQASKADIFPLVNFCLANSFSRSEICAQVQGVTLNCANESQAIQTYYQAYSTLLFSKGSIVSDVKTFLQTLERENLFPASKSPTLQKGVKLSGDGSDSKTVLRASMLSKGNRSSKLSSAINVPNLKFKRVKIDGKSERKLHSKSERKLHGKSERKLHGKSERKLHGKSERKLNGKSERKLNGKSERKLKAKGINVKKRQVVTGRP